MRAIINKKINKNMSYHEFLNGKKLQTNDLLSVPKIQNFNKLADAVEFDVFD